MTYPDDLRSTARIAGHPIHPMLVPVPIVCFVGALITDVTYFATANIMWADFSTWLITIGVIMGVLAAIAGLIDFLGNRLIRTRRPAWPHVLGNLLVLVLAIVQHAGSWPRCLDFGRSDRIDPVRARRSHPAGHGLAGLVDGLSLRRGSGPMTPIMSPLKVRAATLVLMCAAGFLLAGCDDRGGDPRAEIGPNPNLPALQQYPLPADAPCHRHRMEQGRDADGAAGNENPGARHRPAASALALCAAQRRRAGGGIQGAGRARSRGRRTSSWAGSESWVTSGGNTGESNRITLLRDTNGDGVPDVRSVFLDHLNSPFGVALVGNDLYVADTDAIVRYPYTEGETKITRLARRCAAAGRADRPSLDQEPDRQPGRHEALCRRRLQQQHHRERHGGREEPRGHPARSTAPPAAGASSPADCAIRTA